MFSAGVGEQKARVIPVLVDVCHNDIPEFLRWVVCIDVKDTNYLEQLRCAVKGRLYF